MYVSSQTKGAAIIGPYVEVTKAELASSES
jgi:hypothetical protein